MTDLPILTPTIPEIPPISFPPPPLPVIPILGTSDKDRLKGTNNDDDIFGFEKKDRLNGRGGNDTLDGGSGNDRLIGGNGDDTLDGGGGKDRLTGGKGSDIFVIGNGRGRDIITDFRNGVDKIELAEGIEFDDILIESRGANSLISIADTGRKIALLRKVSANSLGSEDFVRVDVVDDEFELIFDDIFGFDDFDFTI